MRRSSLFILAAAVAAVPVAAWAAADDGGTVTLQCPQAQLQAGQQVTCDVTAVNPAPTTTVAPTTTLAPTTTRATTTTTAPPTTTTPPAGVQFSEDFSSPDSVNRFDYALDGIHPSVDTGTPSHWMGDHDRNCGSPDTKRDVQRGTASNISDLVWYCAPGGDPAKGHLMTSFVTFGYDILAFSPKQYFTDVSKVCWDQNLTFEGGRRWTQLAIVRRADVEREAQEVEKWEGEDGFGPGHLNLGFVGPDHRHDLPTNDIEPSDPAILVRVSLGHMQVSTAMHFAIGDLNAGVDDLADGTADGYLKYENLANRFQHCIKDNGNGTLTVSRERADGKGIVSSTFAGAFPDGQVRVVFEDDQYDGPKDVEYDPSQNTWHWDNLEVS
jgi:hypothetical protein